MTNSKQIVLSKPLRRPGIAALMAFVCTVLALEFGSVSFLLILDLACIYAIAALGLTIVFGMADLLSVAQAGLMAVGGYALALLLPHLDTFWPTLLLSAIAGGFAGGILGLVAARIRSHYFILISLAFAEGILLLVVNLAGLTGGSNGIAIQGSLTPLPGWVLDGPTAVVTLVMPAAWIAWYLAECAATSRLGLALRAAKADEYLALASGVAVARSRFVATVVGGAYAGAAGAFLAILNGYIGPQSFDLDTAILLLLIVVLAGAGSSTGTLVAAGILTFLTHGLLTLRVTGELVYGIGILVLLVFAPGGLAGIGMLIHKQMGRLRRPSRRGEPT